MSRGCGKESKRPLGKGGANNSVAPAEINFSSDANVTIGEANVKRWLELKTALNCKTDEEFSTILLDLAERHVRWKGAESDSTSTTNEKQEEPTPTVHQNPVANGKKKEHTKHKRKKEKEEKNNLKINFDLPANDVRLNNFSGLLSTLKNEPTRNLDKAKLDTKIVEESSLSSSNSDSKLNTDSKGNLVPKNSILKNSLLSSKNEEQKISKRQFDDQEKTTKKPKTVSTKRESEKKGAKKVDHDIRKAPELEVQIENKLEIRSHTQNSIAEEKVEKENEESARFSIKIKLCCNCGTKHIQDLCPLQIPHFVVPDVVTKEQWTELYKDLVEKKLQNNEDSQNGNETNEEICKKYSFANMSLPNMLYFEDSNTSHGLSVFAKSALKEFTQFGPLVGKKVKEVDISEDSTMRDIWEVNCDKTSTYISTENANDGNWLQYVRPAPNRDGRNISVISRNNELFFITTRNIEAGEELLYWQDDNFGTNKKKMEKTTCGGCNMTFTHPLYYRIHCSVFHDVRYSLTIRKYHCKICGAAVLGKENIMKHAAELHNGQGAYQCQFCKKFFLRLNYLEMHRTYGCSANPHRSRPLCDFCGRKFCQPQKLKVHIKRMHSDMAEVLKEFQCKNCLKILGSRAALQRHLKEVHQKQVDGACACSRCGKLFQNKSNLKIHMLTHSGIKPFKCAENNCIAAFTTKQCLQFHYKKIHGFTEDMMPKITRSVDYTFEAYSGVEDQENGENRAQNRNEEDLMDMKNMDETTSEMEDNSLDDRNVDDPQAIDSPSMNDQSSNQSPPPMETYAISNVKILTKGSKKWIGDTPLQPLKPDMYMEHAARKGEESTLDVEDTQQYDPPKLATNLNAYNRHESSNASLLVEAALDSVCSEPNIDIDVSSTSGCADALVNNLYTLAHPDTLPDVTYNHDVNESREINLISPSVNDHISVTDDLNDDLRHSQNIGLDYSTFHQEDFSPANSPMQNRNSFVRDYINVNPVSPQDTQNYEESQSKNVSPGGSPPRYDFGHTVNNEHISSDDSNGIGAQNLSLHHPKDGIQLDLSLYKSPYNIENNFSLRKDLRMKFDMESDRKQVYVLDVEDVSKNYEESNKFGINENTQVENLENNNLSEKDFENIDNADLKHKESELESNARNLDTRNKFDIDLDLRMKNYENIETDLRSRTVYDGTIDDFRIKNYDLGDNLEGRSNLDVRNKIYDGLMESDFRTDRNFEPLVLNSDLQGLDMSARSYHNYSNLNRYHHLYSEVERPSVDLRLNYSPPPPSYTHADILRVVSLDLTPPGRHSVDLSLRSHQISNSRLLTDHSISTNAHRLTLDQSRLLTTDLSTTRHLSTDSRLLTVSDMSNRILSDHTTNRILANDQLSSNRLLSADQRLIGDESRLISDQTRLMDQSRLLSDTRILPAPSTSGAISPVPYAPYSVSPSPYHPTALPPRPHAGSPTPPYHHYTAYY